MHSFFFTSNRESVFIISLVTCTILYTKIVYRIFHFHLYNINFSCSFTSNCDENLFETGGLSQNITFFSSLRVYTTYMYVYIYICSEYVGCYFPQRIKFANNKINNKKQTACYAVIRNIYFCIFFFF